MSAGRRIRFYSSGRRLNPCGSTKHCFGTERFLIQDSLRSCQGSNTQGWLYGAFQSAEAMQEQGTPVSVGLAYRLVQECTKWQDLGFGRKVQNLIFNSELGSFPILSDQLIRLFTSCGNLVEANEAFSKILEPNHYTWNAILAAHAKLGNTEAPFKLFNRVFQEGGRSDKFIFSCILNACGSTGAIPEGRLIHGQVIEAGLQSDIVVTNTLVNMYAKCAYLEEARNLFGKSPNIDIVTWGAMLAGYAQHGEGLLALQCFEDMKHEGIKPDKIAFLSIIKACGSLSFIEWGRSIHQQIIESGLQADVLGSILVDMYAKCGNLEEACNVFSKLPVRDVVTWGAMITGYAQHGEGFLALECFEDMQSNGTNPDKVIFLSILKACSTIGAIEQGRCIHEQIIQSEFQSDLAVGNTLVDMYAKCGNMNEAWKVFEALPDRDVVTWGAIISGYAQHGEGLHALECFRDMASRGIKPSKVTFLSILKACTSIGAVDEGRQIHDKITESEVEFDIVLGSTLVDMYAKCGNLEEAHKIFDALPNRDVIAWGAMIAGYVQRGNVTLARQYLEGMQQEGVKPNAVIFASILAACSHAGLVNEGRAYFGSMIKDHGIIPDSCHYSCMVDLLGRAGQLNEAEDLLQCIHPDVIGWTSLLAACRTYGNVSVGRRCFDQILQIDPHNAGAYVHMSGIYSDASMWKEAAQVEEDRYHAQAWKKPAKAWIEVNNKVHEFIVGDTAHPQAEEIYAMLNSLSNRMKEAGYMPKLDLVMNKMSDNDKEDALCGHCEKLAVAFGIVSTPPGTIIRATKNLRVCMDCHNATKIISKLEGRDIIIRDAYRLHHFSNGSCSCGDYH